HDAELCHGRSSGFERMGKSPRASEGTLIVAPRTLADKHRTRVRSWMRCGKCYRIRAARGAPVSVPPRTIDFLGTLPDKAPVDTIFRPRRQRGGDSLRSEE